MSGFSITKISLKQLVLAGAALVIVAGVAFWFTGGQRGTGLSPDQQAAETKRLEVSAKEAYLKIPRPWLKKKL